MLNQKAFLHLEVLGFITNFVVLLCRAALQAIGLTTSVTGRLCSAAEKPVRVDAIVMCSFSTALVHYSLKFCVADLKLKIKWPAIMTDHQELDFSAIAFRRVGPMVVDKLISNIDHPL